jgi:5-methylthioadenosine/S-adenosylhomocysteine deaminase
LERFQMNWNRSRQRPVGTRLLRGRYVVTDPGALPGAGGIADGAVLVEGGAVSAVGAWADLRARHPDTEVLGSARHMVLPGLVNAHHHGRGLSGIQLGMPDDVLERWLVDFWRMPPLDSYLDTLHANLKMIRSGVTCVLHAGYAREWGHTEAETRAALRAYGDSGLRVAYAVGVEDALTLTLGDDRELLASLPAPLAERARDLLAPPDQAEIERYFDLVAALAEETAGDARTRILHGPSWHIWCSPGLLDRVAADAATRGLGIHMHALESPLERDSARRAYGTDTLTYLEARGILGPRTTLAHGTWLSDAEIERCAATGTAVAHNPSSNLRLRNGVAPLARMLAAGVAVGIGMDSWGLASDDDMLAEMRLAASLHRAPEGDRFGPRPDPFDILRMATVGGAAAAGFGDDGLGRLLPGCPADALLVDYDALCAPYLAPDVHPVTAFVHLAKPAHVDTVLVAGEPILTGGRIANIDEDAVALELAAVAAKPASAAFEVFAATLSELKPYVARYYEGWGGDG